MKIALICAGYESLGLEYLSSALKLQHNKTNLFFHPALFASNAVSVKPMFKLFDSTKTLAKQIMRYAPDVICFSVVTDSFEICTEIAKQVKAKLPKTPIIFGGMHISLNPKETIALSYVDYICIGEGEEAICSFVKNLKSGQPLNDIKNIFNKNTIDGFEKNLSPLNEDLDSIPFPDKDLFYSEFEGFKSTYTITSGRGCPYICSYCCHKNVKQLYEGKKYIRRRSVDNVIAELKQAKKKYNIKHVFFCDDLFLYNDSWIKDFAEKYRKEINLPFAAEAHPSHVNENNVKLLEKAGCVTVGMGIEAINKTIRNEILSRKETTKTITAAIKAFQKSNIFLCCDILAGIPSQTETDLIKTALYFNKNKPDFVFPFWLKFYPKMPIIDILVKKGIFSKEKAAAINADNSFSPFRGNKFDKSHSKLINLCLASPILPATILKKIIRYKAYRFFPKGHLLFMHLTAMSLSVSKRFRHSKKKLVFSSTGRAKFYIVYSLRKLLNKA